VSDARNGSHHAAEERVFGAKGGTKTSPPVFQFRKARSRGKTPFSFLQRADANPTLSASLLLSFHYDTNEAPDSAVREPLAHLEAFP